MMQHDHDPNKKKTTGRVYAVTQCDVDASNAVVLGTIFVISVLFDPGAAHSFISCSFTRRVDIVHESLEYEICIATPSGDCLVLESIYKRCLVRIEERDLSADLLLLDLFNFDVILGMDWLVSYHVNQYYTQNHPNIKDSLQDGLIRIEGVKGAIAETP